MDQAAARRQNIVRLVKAAAWMSGTLMSFASMIVAVREVSDTMGSFEILFFRSLVGLVIVLALAARYGRASIRTRRPVQQTARNILHLGGQFGWVYGIALLPLAEVTAIEFTTPIWLAILATIFLGERLNRGRLVAIAFGFAGILIILRPGIEVVQPASLVVLGSAVCYASTHIFTKKLTETDTALAILFYMTVIQLPLTFAPAYFDWTPPVWADAPWLVLIGVTALTAHYCLVCAFRLADATIAMPMDFLRLPLIALVGFLAYGEALEVAVLGGALLICAGNYYSIHRESRAGDAARSPAVE